MLFGAMTGSVGVCVHLETERQFNEIAFWKGKHGVKVS